MADTRKGSSLYWNDRNLLLAFPGLRFCGWGAICWKFGEEAACPWKIGIWDAGVFLICEKTAQLKFFCNPLSRASKKKFEAFYCNSKCTAVLVSKEQLDKLLLIRKLEKIQFEILPCSCELWVNCQPLLSVKRALIKWIHCDIKKVCIHHAW